MPFLATLICATVYSTDAGLMSATLRLENVCRFARGGEVVASNGLPAWLERSLDFLVVTDHAENLGLAHAIFENNPDLISNDWGRMIANIFYQGTRERMMAACEEW